MFRATFRNGTGAPVTNEEGNPRADFIITTTDGLGAWSYRSSGVFTQELVRRSYADGEEASFEITWDGLGCARNGESPAYLPVGRYFMHAVWAGANGGSSEPVSFQIG